MTVSPIIEFAKRELAGFESRLHKLQEGHIRVGHTHDGNAWTDTTDEEIKIAKFRIAELKDFLERGDVPRS